MLIDLSTTIHGHVTWRTFPITQQLLCYPDFWGLTVHNRCCVYRLYAILLIRL